MQTCVHEPSGTADHEQEPAISGGREHPPFPPRPFLTIVLNCFLLCLLCCSCRRLTATSLSAWATLLWTQRANLGPWSSTAPSLCVTHLPRAASESSSLLAAEAAAEAKQKQSMWVITCGARGVGGTVASCATPSLRVAVEAAAASDGRRQQQQQCRYGHHIEVLAAFVEVRF